MVGHQPGIGAGPGGEHALALLVTALGEQKVKMRPVATHQNQPLMHRTLLKAEQMADCVLVI